MWTWQGPRSSWVVWVFADQKPSSKQQALCAIIERQHRSEDKVGRWEHLRLQSCVQDTCGSFRLHQHRCTGTEPTPNQTQLKKSLEQFFLIKLKYHLIMVEIDFFCTLWGIYTTLLVWEKGGKYRSSLWGEWRGGCLKLQRNLLE